MSEKMPEVWVEDYYEGYRAYPEPRISGIRYIRFDKHQSELATYKAAVRDMAEALKGVSARCCGEYPGHPETLAVTDALAKHAALIEKEGE